MRPDPVAGPFGRATGQGGGVVAEGHPNNLALEPRDIETLAYIHSNKFITTKLFHRKFHPHQSYVTACVHLRALEARGLVMKVRKFQNDDTYYYLPSPVLKALSGLARILTSPEFRAPHINPLERHHDKQVLALRIQIEREGGLEGLTWLSDYEMRCGLRLDWKRALEEGRGWDLAGAKLRRVYHRTPDGYFEGTLGGQDLAFALEYENTPYNRDKMVAMVLNLNRDFPEAFKLVVSRDKPHALRMLNGLDSLVRGDLRSRRRWAFSFFEMVDAVPFTRVPWVTLEQDYLPFVKDPILKLPLANVPAMEQPKGATA